MVKNTSRSYKAYEQVAAPNAGAKVPAGKPDADQCESTKQAPSVKRQGKAKDLAGKEQKGASLAAVRKQMGRHADNMTQSAAANCADADLEY
jgi:hypothetical protein